MHGSQYNILVDIRHGPTGGNGTYQGANRLRVQVNVWNGKDHVNYYVTGTFASNCTAITWDTTNVPNDPGVTRSLEVTEGIWCKAWTIGCLSPSPPYGLTMGFLQTLGDNMVLQRAPAKAAVYGV